MLEKKIKYQDYDGNEREDVFRFNFTEAEVVELQFSEVGTLKQVIEKIIQEKDQKRLIELFKKLILSAYGEKSMDGKRFIKSQDLREEFSQTEAYSNLFMELATDADAASKFVNGVMPQKFKTNRNGQTIVPVSQMANKNGNNV